MSSPSAKLTNYNDEEPASPQRPSSTSRPSRRNDARNSSTGSSQSSSGSSSSSSETDNNTQQVATKDHGVSNRPVMPQTIIRREVVSMKAEVREAKENAMRAAIHSVRKTKTSDRHQKEEESDPQHGQVSRIGASPAATAYQGKGEHGPLMPKTIIRREIRSMKPEVRLAKEDAMRDSFHEIKQSQKAKKNQRQQQCDHENEETEGDSLRHDSSNNNNKPAEQQMAIREQILQSSILKQLRSQMKIDNQQRNSMAAMEAREIARDTIIEYITNSSDNIGNDDASSYSSNSKRKSSRGLKHDILNMIKELFFGSTRFCDKFSSTKIT